jgi:hypothetical protein
MCSSGKEVQVMAVGHTLIGCVGWAETGPRATEDAGVEVNYPRFRSDFYRRIRNMPRQYSPEFRQRALRLLDTTMEASDISEFEAIKSVAGKVGISEESVCRWRRKHRSMPESVLVRLVLSMPKSASSSVR